MALLHVSLPVEPIGHAEVVRHVPRSKGAPSMRLEACKVAAIVRGPRPPGARRQVCDKLVATEGPCAVACKPEELIAFIPDGTCATFACDLDDGTQYITGGCNR